MSHMLLGSTVGIDTFSPSEHLLGIVQDAVASRVNTRVALHGIGDAVILPERGVYYASVRNMDEFCSALPSQFTRQEVDTTVTANSPHVCRSITDLLWQTAFHASRGRLVDGCSRCDIVQFRHWPNLTRLPVTPNAARICSLLTRHRTTIMLVHRILGIDDAEVCQIYSAAYCAGIANSISGSDAEHHGIEAHDLPAAPDNKHGLFHSLLTKISGL